MSDEFISNFPQRTCEIIVTTPKKQRDVAAREAQECILAGGGFYFRRFGNQPRKLHIGTRIFYVEEGYVRGFATVSEAFSSDGMQCETTGRKWPRGFYAIMAANSWKWIRPLVYKGFQGWRYFDGSEVKIVGDWLAPKPLEMNDRRAAVAATKEKEKI